MYSSPYMGYRPILWVHQWLGSNTNIGILGPNCMGSYRMRNICPSFHAHDAEVLTSCCKTNTLAVGVMVRRASFSSTAVMSASPCAGSRRAQRLNKPLGDPDSREEMILPQDTV